MIWRAVFGVVAARAATTGISVVSRLAWRSAEPTISRAMKDRVTLRPVQEPDLRELIRIYSDPAIPGEFQWFGFRPAQAREIRRQWAEDGLIGTTSSRLAVSLDGGCAGGVTWRPVGETGNLEIGSACSPSYRGRGIGTEAQRQLVEYLLAVTPVHRIQA